MRETNSDNGNFPSAHKNVLQTKLFLLCMRRPENEEVSKNVLWTQHRRERKTFASTLILQNRGNTVRRIIKRGLSETLANQKGGNEKSGNPCRC